MLGKANPQCREAGQSLGLTVEAYVPVGQGQERGVQRVVGVTEDGVPLVDLLHHSRVQAVLLKTGGLLGQAHASSDMCASAVSHT